MPIDPRRGGIARLQRAAAGTAASLLLAPALAETPPWNVGASLAVAHDNNIFRAPAGAAVADRSSVATVLGNLDLVFGRQRLKADASLQHSRYATRDDLNHTGHALHLGWTGATGGAISWNVALGAQRRLGSYASARDEGLRVANLESSREASATLQWGWVAQGIASVSVSRRELDQSAAAYASQSYTLDSVALGLQLNPLRPLTFSVGPRLSHGRFPQAQIDAQGQPRADTFNRGDLDLQATWRATGASTLTARLSLSRQRHRLLSDRDIGGSTGSFGWQWVATGKTTFNTSLSRDTGTETSFLAEDLGDQRLTQSGDSSRLTTSLATRVDHELTGKITLGASGRYSLRQLTASSVIGLDSVTLPTDRSTANERSAVVGLNIRYRPTQQLTLRCDWSHERRGDAAPFSAAYRDHAVGCSAQFLLR
jgi:hypothetical protein